MYPKYLLIDYNYILTFVSWANKVRFASDTYDAKFPTMPLEIQHGRDHLTAKTMVTFFNKVTLIIKVFVLKCQKN